MNRIYQGRATAVEIPDGKDAHGQPQWKPLADWPARLWEHHELFQDAVNYYTLCLAALATGLRQDSDEAKAALSWRKQVRDTWKEARRKAIKFSGPHARVAKLLGLEPDASDFDACAARSLAGCGASAEQRATALMRILEEADKRDLNQLANELISPLCAPKGQCDYTPKTVVAAQETERIRQAKALHEATANNFQEHVAALEPGRFVTQMPTEEAKGEEARIEALKQFKSAAKKNAELAASEDAFVAHLAQIGETLEVPRLGRKPSGLYPFALVLKLWPTVVAWEAFKTATKSLSASNESAVVTDPIADARVGDAPVFEYFTNRVLFREPGNENQAVWKEFDVAALLEAIKAPHRHFQDTQSRLKEGAKLRAKLEEIERGEPSGIGDEGDEGIEEEHIIRFGFKDDTRIPLLVRLVMHRLGYLEAVENPEQEPPPRDFLQDCLRRHDLMAEPGRREYTIQERTLRGWSDIREEWRNLVRGNGWTGLSAEEQEEKLWAVVKKSQGEHRDDFGSATLYRALVEPHFQSIWRDDGNQRWHAPDPLRAWRDYTELRFELADVERPIRFTPAHAEHSPRYFILPKMGRFGSDHLPGSLAFTCGIILKTACGLEPVEVRVSYAAPRLFRDTLRRPGDSELESVPWLQPMMQALGLPELDTTDFANCRVTLQPAGRDNIQLTFPVPIEPTKLQALLGHQDKWSYQPSGKAGQKNFAQFNYSASESRVETTLRWPSDIAFAKEAGQPRKQEPEPWHQKLDSFSCLAVDLGQRGAGAFARLEARCDGRFGTNKKGVPVPTRFIGETGSKQWRAALSASGLFRLPGEDAKVWRAHSPKDKDQDAFAWREELWGDRGRPGLPFEVDDTADLMRQFEAVERDADGQEKFLLLPDKWDHELTFPEQNDKLLIAARRAQSRLARLHRWCWFLADDTKRAEAFKEISECEDERLAAAAERERAKKLDPRLADDLRVRLEKKRQALPPLLERLANRILPLRPKPDSPHGRQWAWNPHPNPDAQKNGCHLLEIVPTASPTPRTRGQRGLSFPRIEQIEELRKRFQSLNQALRRKPGDPPLKRRDDSIPDPCPALLDKLEAIKTQRVNQTAHMILAAALGLKLAPPPQDKRELNRTRDVHGQYVREREPVDFIVIEDLSRYRASQGRAPRENSRLMKWCHRAVREKLRELCEPFGMPVVETPAAYSSRFCARSGVAGFRAVEVTAEFTQHGHWSWRASRKDDTGNLTADAQWLQDLDRQLTQAQDELTADWKFKHPSERCPRRTALVPQAGGPIFVPVEAVARDAELAPKVVQADVNAAINLGLRAIADPRLWRIHPRLRTQRAGATNTRQTKSRGKRSKKSPTITESLVASSSSPQLLTSEKRKFGVAGVALNVGPLVGGNALEQTSNPNYFRDFAELEEARWDIATVTDPRDPSRPVTLVSGKALWSAVKKRQWSRCQEINQARFAAWRNKLNQMPD